MRKQALSLIEILTMLITLAINQIHSVKCHPIDWPTQFYGKKKNKHAPTKHQSEREFRKKTVLQIS